MVKDQLTQQVMDMAGVEFGQRTVERIIGGVFTTVIGQLFAADPNQYNYYCKRVTLPVVNRVATLTIPLIQTKYNANGVPRIMLTGDETTEFYPSPAYSTNSSADANNISGMVFYVVTANNIRFNKSLPDTVTEVLADVVPEYQAYDKDDFINLPAGVAQMIIDGAVAAVKGDPSLTNIYKKK
jgi:hypothetical protein